MIEVPLTRGRVASFDGHHYLCTSPRDGHKTDHFHASQITAVRLADAKGRTVLIVESAVESKNEVVAGFEPQARQLVDAIEAARQRYHNWPR